MSLPSSGRFSVVSVWRPEVKVSSALPSRKKIAHWLSWTMSWAPSLMSAEPDGRLAVDDLLPGLVEVLDDLEQRHRLPPYLMPARIVSRSASRASSGVERARSASTRPAFAVAAAAARRPPHASSTPPEQAEVELVDALEHGLVHLDRRRRSPA